MSSISLSWRASGENSASLKQTESRLVPYPRIHYLAPSYSPFVSVEKEYFESFTVQELTSQLIDSKQHLISI